MGPAFSTLTKFGTYQRRELNRAPAAIDSNNRIFAVALVPAPGEIRCRPCPPPNALRNLAQRLASAMTVGATACVGFWTPITFGRSAEKCGRL